MNSRKLALTGALLLGVSLAATQAMAQVAPTTPPDAPKFEEIKLIDYDTPRWGSPAERSRLLKKFDDEVKALPR